MNREYPLEGLLPKLKLQYSGHMLRRADSLGKTLMLGKIEGGRKMGRQKMRRLDGHEFEQTPGAGEGQGSPAVLSSCGLAKSQTRLRNNCTSALAPVSWECPPPRKPPRKTSLESQFRLRPQEFKRIRAGGGPHTPDLAARWAGPRAHGAKFRAPGRAPPWRSQRGGDARRTPPGARDPGPRSFPDPGAGGVETRG